MEQERLEKLARKGQKAEGTSASSGGADAKASESTASTSSTAGVSTDKNRNYAVVAGVVTGLGALGWYLKSKNKKTDELQD
nr:hypothetical protein CTI12_AA419540 [Tanacetum cinerariifolium]